MKIVYIHCGLGNQMFQYAFYKFLRKQGHKNLRLEATAPSMRRHGGFLLKKIFPEIAKNKDFLPYWLARLFYLLVGDVLKKGFKINLMTDSYPIPRRKIWLKGYWQENSYVEAVENELFHDFAFLPVTDDRNREVLEQIRQTESVSIHIRRGDYVEPNNPLAPAGVCTPAYYEKAIAYIKERIANPCFFVFSDDQQWVRENLNIGPAVYIDWNKGKNNFRDMQLMSECKHNIIANSSFSWWGARLNKHINNIVITPPIWFFGYPPDFLEKLIPLSWHKLT